VCAIYASFRFGRKQVNFGGGYVWFRVGGGRGDLVVASSVVDVGSC